MIFYWSDYKPINYLDNIWWNCWNNVFNNIHIFMSGLFLKISQFEMSTFQWDIVKSENRQTVNILNVMCYLFANKSKSIIFVFVKSWKDWRDTWIYWNDRLIYNVSAIFINVCYSLWGIKNNDLFVQCTLCLFFQDICYYYIVSLHFSTCFEKKL